MPANCWSCKKAACTVGQRGGEFVVSEKGEDLQKFPRNQVRAIYLFGAVQLTAQATQTCLEHGIDVAYSPAGRFLGRRTYSAPAASASTWAEKWATRLPRGAPARENFARIGERTDPEPAALSPCLRHFW